jgi:LEA14-like dessication related protein
MGVRTPDRAVATLALGAVRLSLVAIVLAVASCATFGPRLAPPTVTVNDVALESLDGLQARFVAAVTLANPNDREVAVDALDATLSIEGEPVATANLVAPVTLPANGTADARIVARTGIDAILRAVAAAMRRLGTPGAPLTTSPALHYVIEGTARFGGGLRVPFRRSGELGPEPRPAR